MMNISVRIQVLVAFQGALSPRFSLASEGLLAIKAAGHRKNRLIAMVFASNLYEF